MEHSLDFDFNVGQPENWEKVWRKAIEVAARMEAKKRALSKVINLIVIFNNTNKNISIDLTQYEAAMKVMQETCQLKECYDDEDTQIIVDLLTYNNRNPKTLIRVCDDDQLVAVVKMLHKQFGYRYDFFVIVNDIFAKKNRTNFELALLHYFVIQWCDKIFSYGYNDKTLRNFVRNDPETANTYFDLLLKGDAVNSFFDYGLLKKYSHLKFDEKFIKYHSETNAANISSSDFSNIVKGLALLMPSDNFLNFVSQYLPKKTKLDVKDYDLKKTYKLHCAVIKGFQQVEEPAKVIPYLSSVCREDYLQASLPTMYNILNRINESVAYLFIDSLKDKPVSLRKHCAFLAFIYMPLNLAVKVYTSVSAKEKNVSMKKHYLTSIIKVFLKNPIGSIMDIVLSKIDTLDKNDDESLDKLTSIVDSIPLRFRAAYIEKLWRKLDTFTVDVKDKLADNTSKYRYTLIKQTQTCFCNVVFTDRFCRDVIGGYFLSDMNGDLFRCNDINIIVMHYLQSNNSQHFDFIFDIISTFRGNKWIYQNNHTKQLLYSFFDMALSKLITFNTEVLHRFETYWKKIFSFTEHFSGFCSLEILKLFKASAGNNRMFAEGIDRLFQNIIVTCGPHVNLLLKDCLQSFCKLDNSKISNNLLEDLIIDMLTNSDSPLNRFIAMNIAPNVGDDQKKNQIIELLSRQHDQLSEIFYHSLIL